MSGTADDLNTLATGGPLGWGVRKRLATIEDEQLLDAGLSRLETTEQPTEWAPVLTILSESLWSRRNQASLAEPPRPARLAACLGRGALVGDEDAVVNYGPIHAVFECLTAYQQLFANIGAAGLEPLRDVVYGRPLGALTYFPMAQNYRVHILGAKLVGLQTIDRYGEPADAEPLSRLSRSLAEDPWTRAEAAMIWHRWQPDEALAAIVEQIFSVAVGENPQANSSLFWHYVDRLMPLGEALVPAAIARLGAAEYRIRYRATTLLTSLRETAVPALTEVVRTSDEWHARQNAESALAQIDKRSLKQALADRREAGRGLSLSKSPPPDADRGLSRGEP